MSDYSTFEDRLVTAISADPNLPEFFGNEENGAGKVTKYGNVFALHGYSFAKGGKKLAGKSIAESVQYHVVKNGGLALCFFGRAGGDVQKASKRLIANVSYLAELYVDPVRFLRTSDKTLDEIEENVLKAIHGRIIPPAQTHMEALKVKGWKEVVHDEMYATRIEIERPFGMF